MNIENFMDPMGGAGPDTVNAGLLGILGFGMDHGLYNMFVGRPLYRAERRYLRKTYMTDKLDRGLIPQGISEEEINARRGQQRRLGRELFNKEGKPKLNKLKGTLKSQSKWSRRLGWAFIISGLMEVGEMIATPGISKAAARSNKQLMMDERVLDSGRAHTQRQRGLQAIYSSQAALGNQIFGQEASYMHSRY